jgi:hypothetical protein
LRIGERELDSLYMVGFYKGSGDCGPLKKRRGLGRDGRCDIYLHFSLVSVRLSVSGDAGHVLRSLVVSAARLYVMIVVHEGGCETLLKLSYADDQLKTTYSPCRNCES